MTQKRRTTVQPGCVNNCSLHPKLHTQSARVKYRASLARSPSWAGSLQQLASPEYDRLVWMKRGWVLANVCGVRVMRGQGCSVRVRCDTRSRREGEGDYYTHCKKNRWTNPWRRPFNQGDENNFPVSVMIKYICMAGNFQQNTNSPTK